jgi:hypothetical protein
LAKLEDSDGTEITVRELVDKYYNDPEKYFEKLSLPQEGSRPPTDERIERNKETNIEGNAIIKEEEENQQQSRDRETTDRDIQDEYPVQTDISSESEEKQVENTKNTPVSHDSSKNLFGATESNNNVISSSDERRFTCFYCTEPFSNDLDRVQHIDSSHSGKMYYPTQEDFESRLER